MCGTDEMTSEEKKKYHTSEAGFKDIWKDTVAQLPLAPENLEEWYEGCDAESIMVMWQIKTKTVDNSSLKPKRARKRGSDEEEEEETGDKGEPSR